MTTAPRGMPSFSPTRSAAATHGSPAIPVISVKRVIGARSRVETLYVPSPTHACGSRAPGTVEGWKYSSGSPVEDREVLGRGLPGEGELPRERRRRRLAVREQQIEDVPAGRVADDRPEFVLVRRHARP